MDVRLIMLGIIFGVGLLTMIGCFLYYLSMAYDILEGVTGRSDKPPHYIPRTSKESIGYAK